MASKPSSFAAAFDDEDEVDDEELVSQLQPAAVPAPRPVEEEPVPKVKTVVKKKIVTGK
jgi:hypothetical protein